jgi:hypothetical protein
MDFLVGAVFGAVVVAIIPQEKKDRLKGWILSKWQKVTKKG